MFDRFFNLLSITAIYQVMRLQFAARRLLLTRKEFAAQKYMVLVTCDGLLALANRGLPLQLVIQGAPPSNGAGAPRVGP